MSQLVIAQQTLVGVASAIDGDTLEIQSNEIRLHGVDAPGATPTLVGEPGYRARLDRDCDRVACE